MALAAIGACVTVAGPSVARADILHEPYNWQVAGNFLRAGAKAQSRPGLVKRAWAAKVSVRPKLRELSFTNGRVTFEATVKHKGRKYQRLFRQHATYPQTLVPVTRQWKDIGQTRMRAWVGKIPSVTRSATRSVRQRVWFLRPKR